MKSDEGESLLQKLKGLETLRQVTDNVKRFLRPRGQKLAEELAALETLQACKDAALVGDDDLRLLSICKLPEFGEEARDALEIALYDINTDVCAAAIGMIHAIGEEISTAGVPEEKLSAEKVKAVLRYVDQAQTVKEEEENEAIPQIAARRADIFSNELPVRTIHYIEVESECQEHNGTVSLLVTLRNEGKHSVKSTRVSLLTYPSESLVLESDKAAQVGKLSPSEKAQVKFEFKKIANYVEGEMVTAVVMKNHHGQDVSAKSGNCLIRSLYPQMKPLDLSSSEFRVVRMQMKPWSREHVLRFNPRSLFRLLKQLFKDKNLHKIREEVSETDGMMRAQLIGAAKSIFNQTRVVIQLTLVGKVDESKTKVKIDVFSDEEDILHIAASRIYEAVHQQFDAAR